MLGFRSVQLAAMASVLFVSVGVSGAPVPSGTVDEIRERVAPVGRLCRAGEDCGSTTAVAGGGTLSGEQVYSKFCFACHATGVSDAPKLGDAVAWAPRLDKGMDELVKSTINGLNIMPAKGTCMSCSDEELQDAVDYMVADVK